VFFKTRETFGELSNMAGGYPLAVSSLQIPSSEALYQACRFPHMPHVQEQIIAQKSPMTAKMVSKPHRRHSRGDWDDIRVAVMKWCLRVKLLNHWSTFGASLLRTGDKPIVEQSRKDPFWGAIPDETGEVLVGTNVLGRLLMELRELLRTRPDHLKFLQPIPIDNFKLLGRDIGPIGTHPVALDPLPLFDRSALDAPVISAPAGRRLPERVDLKTADLQESRLVDSAPNQDELPLFQSEQIVRKVRIKLGNCHVVRSRRGGWDIVREGAKRASAHFDAKRQAVAKANSIARNNKVDVIVHDERSSKGITSVLPALMGRAA
jgi:ribA/ribD-fused uncharacterized protein